MSKHHDNDNELIDDGGNRKTLKSYLLGFVLCIILTLIPFTLVAKKMLSAPYLYLALVVFALLQLFVQVVCFLRLNAKPKGRQNLLAFLFTIFVVVIVVFGSLWIMYNLNYNMMN